MREYFINNKSVFVKKNSLNINDVLNERTNCSFTVIEPTFEITKGMDVYIQQDEIIIFAGKVFKPKSQGDKIKEVIVSCIDYSQMIDKRVIAEVYENTLAGDIVRDLINKYFAEEGVLAGKISDSLLISRAVFNYDNGNMAMNYIADVTGYYWEIDKDKKLNFFNKSTYSAPFQLTDTSRNYKDLKAEEDASKYRNRQYTRGGYSVSSTQTRNFKGDGEAQTWTVDLPLAKQPVIKVNSEVKSVGVRGLDTDREFYWSYNDKSISQETAGTKLTANDVISIQFQGLYPIIVVAENSKQIDERKAIEGGSGIYESVVEESSLDSQSAALEYTQGMLDKYGFIPKVVNFNTYSHGLRAGQLIPINNTKHCLNGVFLIESVTTRADGNNTLYSVKCLDGNNIGGWTNFFKSLVQKQKKLVIRENEILVKLLVFKVSFVVPKLKDSMIFNLHQYHICGQTVIGKEVIL